ncbi:MAG: hypothetical protein LH615_04815, partial [Ferruginibacter sp.]|nr:hypothetical protein [Ferruginibacter sp.]
VKPCITGIKSLIFRDEEKIILESADSKAMFSKVFPFKGALEMWYQKNTVVLTDFKIVFLIACKLFVLKINWLVSFF